MKFVCGFLVLCGLCPLLTNGSELGKTIFSNIQPLVGKEAIAKFKEEPHIRVLYFYKPEFKNRYKLFLKELDKSVEFVELYNVKICMVDCSNEENKKVSECGKPKTERSVFTYRNGMQLLQLELETMFDVNSIMSNLLQLVLLRDVPIFQSQQEVHTFLGRQKGKQDVIFGYMKAIGTFDHRVFMEVAYAYQSKMKFAICTNKEAADVFEEPIPKSDASTIWWVWTKDLAKKEKIYGSLQYKGSLNLAELARFVKYVSKPALFNIPSDGMTHTHDGTDVNLLTFYSKPNRMAEMFNIANIISKNYMSVLGITTINMEDIEVQKHHKCNKKLPAVSLIRKGETEEKFFEGDIHIEFLFRFLEDNLEVPENAVTESRHSDEDDEDHEEEERSDEYFQDIEEVEHQDDIVDFSVSNTRRIPMKLDLVPALTDKTFNTTIKAGRKTIILFYLPFTSMNNINLRYFGEAAERLGDQTTLTVARVNCYDWTDVCQEQNIRYYPTLRVFKKGEMAWDYKGPQDPQEMFSMMKILELSSPRQVEDPVEVMTYLVGQANNDITKVTNTTVVGLFDKKSSKEMEMFKTVAEISRDRIMFVYIDTSDSKKIAQHFGREVPSIIMSKFDDVIHSHVTFEGQYSVESIQNFVQQNKLPKLTELTPLMFPELRRQGDTMVILFTDESDYSTTAKDDLREMVKSQRFTNMSFTMLPTQMSDESSVAFKVLKTYTPEPEVPFLSYVNFKKGEVFNFGRPSPDRQNMIQWLGSIVKGATEPSLKLSNPEWKPLNKGFEFLKIMDFEREQQEKKQSKNKSRGDNIEHAQVDQEEEVTEETTQSTMEDTLDTDTRNDLFKSRLYHQAAGRTDKQKTPQGHDEL